MENYPNHGFILLIPIFLMSLGFIIAFFWTRQRQYLSVLWLSFALLSAGAVMLAQSLISPTHLHQWSMPLGVLYVFTFIALAQSIVLQFNHQVSWKFCLFALFSMEMGLFYYALMLDNLNIRVVLVGLVMALVFGHKLPAILRITPQHPIDKWLKTTFVLVCILLIIQAIFKLRFLFNADFDHNFTSSSSWFIMQFFVLLVSIIFAALIIASNVKDILKVQQLKIENTKLQERLHLSQDLHNTLGNSLTQSMSLISQSKKSLDNQQILSMLKIFRDDLRQVIDSGSSIGANAPATPILWGAPIRHRFSQIFDEIGIHSEWTFAAEWLEQPTQLECLTLQRVAEEALSNIMKHSQATRVLVQLYFSPSRQLILEIEDNGIGFDCEILNNNISVGLKNMQLRTEKIQASMNIQSQSGKTVISVIKSYKKLGSSNTHDINSK
ncbi:MULTISPECIES: ATP-binding protein [unclassified Acinetobacter]|uniref:sensor histidine kinase n=1 Tax=unclassified Acinetobacter TaxID=196816 RepID=UPI00244C2CC0|nr:MULTISPECIES: ATP-binding protein [unclassified Acinetobacter]MDH0032227.1 ATP-binding protein [Acinetobacter sp. GD04021]MDH0885998.1 ATP-binding protein [Acinetobacter sp. GD03873]MDH1082618.1 ATP-binding protein [Acinetobacter sp. GD03983]MDH2189587.1 ATP-binding protein [Acinetobacter sp. GD03645]MDH2203582.1 ATP-binding protein [Acinetobacter sp. GD03647]